MVLSLFFLVALGGTCQRWALFYDPMIAEKLSWLGILFMGGLYVSSLSCILGSLYSAPRVLQCIASDQLLPFMKILDKSVRIAFCNFVAYLSCMSLTIFISAWP